MHMYRQGDVLLMEVSTIPTDCTEVPLDNGRTVLAYGEVTGHAHAIVNPKVKLLAKDSKRYLTVEARTQLRHEEHTHIELPMGFYEVVKQREYTPQGLRNVAD